jgi:hypothetical protein
MKTVIKMVLSAHIIENEEFSAPKSAHVIKLRRMILIGLAGALALATLAPIVVLAG